MGLLVRRILAPIVGRLGSRTILGIGGTLFLLNMVIPDPLPLVDEFLILAGTVLLSRMAQSDEWRTMAGRRAPVDTGEPKHVGRGTTKERVKG